MQSCAMWMSIKSMGINWIRSDFMEVQLPSIFLAYFLGLNFRGYTPNLYGPQYGTNVPPLNRILEFPLIKLEKEGQSQRVFWTKCSLSCFGDPSSSLWQIYHTHMNWAYETRLFGLTLLSFVISFRYLFVSRRFSQCAVRGTYKYLICSYNC